MIEYLPLPEPSGLETSILGLVFQVEPLHLRNGTLQIKCTATIGNGYWVTIVNMTEASINVNAQPSIPGHNRLFSGNNLMTFSVLKSILVRVFFCLLYTSDAA